jgi:hypothetical protein
VRLSQQFRMELVRHHHLITQVRVDVCVTVHREHRRDMLREVGLVEVL